MYTAGGLPNKEELLKQYKPLVVKLARHFMTKLPSSVEVDDLIQVGMIGLLQSLERFDSSQNIKFETFATQRIKGAMLDDLRAIDPMSRSLRKEQKEIAISTAKLRNSLGRMPKDSEVASDLGISLKEYHERVGEIADIQVLSLEDLSEGDEDNGNDFLDRNLGDLISDPLNALEVQRTRKALVNIITLLPDRDQKVLSLYYEEDLNMKEIGEVLSISEARVCQLLREIVKTLRDKMRSFGAGLSYA